MKTLYFLKGLPASGKTTWAKQKQAEDPMIVRVNKDDLRSMLHNGHWSHSNEQQVIESRDYLITQAFMNGRHVIVDDTNLHPKHEEHLRDIAKRLNAQFEVIDFTHISPEECIERDLKRPISVGSRVIWQQYNQFLKPKVEPVAYEDGLPGAIICDLDGTLAHFGDKNPYERDFINDALNHNVSMILDLVAQGEDVFNFPIYIIIVSGRSDKFKEETKQWLDKFGVHYEQLFMRKDDDWRKDSIVKQEIYDQHIKGKYNVIFVLDDRNQVVDMWRKNGLTCLQVAEGNF